MDFLLNIFTLNPAEIQVQKTGLLIQSIGVLGGLFAGSIALRNYITSIEQKKFENSYFLIETFHKNLRKTFAGSWEIYNDEEKITSNQIVNMDPIDLLKQLFFSDFEARATEKIHWLGIKINRSAFFSVPPPDFGVLECACNLFETIAIRILNNTADFRIVYSELGQLMSAVFCFCNKIDGNFFEKNYPNFYKCFKKNESKIHNISCTRYWFMC